MLDLLSTLNSIPQTVSDKLNSVASQATGAVAGALGSISSGISAFGTSLTAAAGSLTKSLQSAGNLSPASLSGAAQQVCGALQPQSIYKGLRPYIPQGVGEQPTDKRDSGSGAGPLKFPEDIGSHYIQLDFSKFKQDSPVTKEIKSDPDVTMTVDFFDLGLVFLNDALSKENFILKKSKCRIKCD